MTKHNTTNGISTAAVQLTYLHTGTFKWCLNIYLQIRSNVEISVENTIPGYGSLVQKQRADQTQSGKKTTLPLLHCILVEKHMGFNLTGEIQSTSLLCCTFERGRLLTTQALGFYFKS